MFTESVAQFLPPNNKLVDTGVLVDEGANIKNKKIDSQESLQERVKKG